MAVTHWTTFLQQSLLQRTSAHEFLRSMRVNQKVDTKQLIQALLRCWQHFCPVNDPLPSFYLEALLSSSVVTTADTILVLINDWNRNKSQNTQIGEADVSVTILQDITMLLISSKLVLDTPDTQKCLVLCSKWLTGIARSMSDINIGGNTRIIETVGSLLATISATPAGVQILSSRKVDASNEQDNNDNKTIEIVRGAVETAIGMFPAISVQTIDRLGIVQKHISMFDNQSLDQSQQREDIRAIEFQNGISDTQMVASRSATRLYIEALLLDATTIDDSKVFEFLLGRHQNDYASMFLDSILSSFLILKSYQSDSEHSLHFQQCRIFILNKLPSVLSTISASSFGGFSVPDMVSAAWKQLQPDLVSQHAMNCGVQFLHVMILYQLLPVGFTSQMVADTNVVPTMPKKLYTKEELVSQIQTNQSRALNLIDELISSHGNASAISFAIVEVMHSYCQNKSTHHLKDITNTLLTTPSTINTLCMFIRPNHLLNPLCTVLDEWKWDEIHGESQPLYDEFGSIVLFILASQRRLKLSRSDIGIKDGNNFIARYLDHEGAEQDGGNLSEESQKLLGDWINALYIADGLNDELTTACSPQDFYLLIPTLLQQSLLAHKRGKLGGDSLRGGLEYFLEPFLLPSLVSAINWICTNVDQDKEIIELMISVFTKTPENPDAKAIHKTIMAMVADATRSLSTSLGERVDQHDLSKFDKVEPFSFESNSQNTSGDLSQTIINHISSITTTTSPAIPRMTRQALQLHGPDKVLDSLVNILLHYSGNNDFVVALDLLATLVCVMDSALRNALSLRFARLGSMLRKGNTLGAEAVIHLHRRVEIYAVVLLAPGVEADPFASMQLPNMDTTNISMDSDNVTTNNLENQQQLDDIDQVLDEAAALGSMEQGDNSLNIDDLYGLQNDSMGLGNLDDLDLDMTTWD